MTERKIDPEDITATKGTAYASDQARDGISSPGSVNTSDALIVIIPAGDVHPNVTEDRNKSADRIRPVSSTDPSVFTSSQMDTYTIASGATTDTNITVPIISLTRETQAPAKGAAPEHVMDPKADPPVFVPVSNLPSTNANSMGMVGNGSTSVRIIT